MLLAFIVVMVGGVSWVVTEAGREAPAPTHGASPASSSPALTPGPTPNPLMCLPDQLQLVGASNACVSLDLRTRSCDVTQVGMDATFYLSDGVHTYELELGISTYSGPGSYQLSSGAAQVDVRDDMNADWRSVAGELDVISSKRPSGTVYANLEPWVGNISALPLSVQGSWSC